MLIDYRKSKYGFDEVPFYYVPSNRQPSSIDLLLSQKDADGLPSSMAVKYMDKNTPLDVKLQLEGYMVSAQTNPLPDDESAFESIIPRGQPLSALEQIIDFAEDNQDKQYDSNLEDNG